MLPLLLAALLTQSPLDTRPVQPDHGPEVRVHRQDGPLVALRLSSPVPADLPEGAVELLQELARPGAQARAHQFGASVRFRHEDGHAVLVVTGPVTAFDALVAILRHATGPPDLGVTPLRRARARAEGRVLARLEQPGPRIRRFLRHGLYGGPEPTGATATRLSPEAVRWLRARLYSHGRIRVVLVGAVPDVVIRSAFAHWPTPDTPPLDDASVPLAATVERAEEARPRVHREWGGIAFPAEGGAVLEVTAELVRQRLAGSTLRHGTVEAWHSPAPALALIGAATPGDTVVAATAGISDLAVQDSASLPATDVRRYLRRLIAEATALVGPEAVATARTAVRRRLLLEARTAEGKAELIGAVAERFGAGTRPDDYLRRLEAVTVAEVRTLLTAVLETPATVAGT